MVRAEDAFYMERALELAEKGRGSVSPNPMVGAVLVKNGRIIGEGFHEKYGGPHAEVNAFAGASEDAAGADLYVTLEPCSHYGKTPPCVELVIRNKIKRVVIASLDPNPLVAGEGIRQLKEAGISVVTGVMKEESCRLNEVFMKYIREKRPFVVMKTAMSLDGKIALKNGESKWITGEKSRKQVHEERSHLSGILVGINTVLEDNPRLTARIPGGRNPVRIVADSKLQVPMDAQILQNQKAAPTILLTTSRADSKKRALLTEKGITILELPEQESRVDLKKAMKELGKRKIDSLLLEGGASLNYSALEAGIIDKVQIYIAPKIIGGKQSFTPVGGSGVEKLKDAFQVDHLRFEALGDDLFLEGYIKK